MSDQLRKKRVLFHSNFCINKTGFARNAKEVLSHLYRTGKYELMEYAAGIRWSEEATKIVPWECRGCLPDSDSELAHLQKLPPDHRNAMARLVAYGSHNIDKVISEFKPDIYIGVEDIWAFRGYTDKKWWTKISPIIHTTLDSLPILDQAVEYAKKTPNFYTWASFAEKDLNSKGLEHVKTIHGIIDHKNFYKLPAAQKADLRAKSKIDPKDFIVGFVFRNQLRKSVPNLLDGFKLFQNQNIKKLKTKLLLHTNFEEKESGWDIAKLAKDRNIDPSDILTTYVCRSCGDYEVKPFSGNDSDCNLCGCKLNNKARNENERSGQRTTSIRFGITEQQLNEVYNLMDVYVHPFTSGGQELPIQEAKLAELITLVTNYSCGEEYCQSNSGGLPLEWSTYYEHGTQFVKASTYPSSIQKQLNRVISLSKSDREKMGQIARQFVIDECSVLSVGKKWEDIIDSLPYSEWDFDMKDPLFDTEFLPVEEPDSEKWLTSLYQGVFHREPDTDGFKYWMESLNKDEKARPYILGFFKEEAKRQNLKNYPPKFESFFTENGRKRLVFVMPKSIGDCYLLSSLFPSCAKTYPDYDIYVATNREFSTIFDGNPFVHKVIPYAPVMEQELFWIGAGDQKGYVDIAFLPHIQTQNQYNYLRNGVDKIAYNIKNGE